MKKIFLPLLTLCAGFLIGKIDFSKNFTKSQDETPSRGIQIRQTGFTFINPLLECEVSSDTSFTELTPFRNELNALVAKEINSKRASYISVYFRDLNNGPWIGINEKDSFSPASLLKVPIAMSIYNKAQTDPSILSKFITYSGTNISKSNLQTIAPQISAEPNKEYTTEDLIRLMLQYSDNNATELLTKIIDAETFIKPYKELGLPLPDNNGTPYDIRVKDYASFFRVLYNSSYLDRSYSNKILEVLTGSKFTEGLQAGVPDDIKIAHKFGERVFENSSEKQLHDCGIVYHPQRPYLLCVMSRGEDLTELKDVIAQISKETYNNVDKQIKAKASIIK